MNMKGLAHDIKTPLTIIYSYFERMLKKESSQGLKTKRPYLNFKKKILLKS